MTRAGDNGSKGTTTPKKRKKRGFLSALFSRGRKRGREDSEADEYCSYSKEIVLVDNGEQKPQLSPTRTDGSSTVVMEPVITKPLHLNFLFVGCPSSGQTSLL